MRKAISVLSSVAVLTFSAAVLAGPGGGGQGGGGGFGGAGGAGGGGIGGAAIGGAGGGDVDYDGDGWTVAQGDCDDYVYSINPGAYDGCNGVDDDCDEQIDEDGNDRIYRDYDGDGYGREADDGHYGCPGVDGYVGIGGDCDDDNSSVNPDANEECNGRDDDCDGSTDEDCHESHDDGANLAANGLAALLLAGWIGVSAWRRRRKLQP